MNITLDPVDFLKLIAGMPVRKDGCRLVLADMSFDFMRLAIDVMEEGVKSLPETARRPT